MIVKGSAAKRHRQSQKRRLRNRAVRSEVHTNRRRFEEALAAGDAKAASEHFASIKRLIDSAVGKGVYHKNTAARTKSRLQKRLQGISDAS